MQRRFLFFLFVLAIAGAASIQSCKHSPLDILVEDPIEPIDTTGDTIIITSNCDPDTVYFENDI